MTDNLLKYKKFSKLKKALSLHNLDENTQISEVISRLVNAEKYEKILITYSTADYAELKYLFGNKKRKAAIDKITSNIIFVNNYLDKHKTGKYNKQIMTSSSLSENYSTNIQSPNKHHSNFILKIDDRHFVIAMISFNINKWLPIPFIQPRIINFESMLYHFTLM